MYEHPDDDSFVIKMANPGKNQTNYWEWCVWNFYKGTEHEKYLCPMVEISDDYKYLIARKAGKCKFDMKVYKKLPEPLKEDAMALCNWGKIDGRLVVLDYGRKSQYDKIMKLKNNK